MAINLSRSSNLFVSSVKFTDGGFSDTNTFEIKVLDGYSFSQSVQTQEIQLEEASCVPVRGSKTFNTALDPVEVSFPLYMKPYDAGASATGAVESVIWDAFASGSGETALVEGATPLEVNFLKSDTHTLKQLQLYFQLDNTTYWIEDVTVGTAEIDFAIDQIAMITFSGTGSALHEVDTTDWVAGTDYKAESPDKVFIRNKLSTVDLFLDSNVATSGWQIADYQGALTGITTSDLIDTTVYTATITVDTVDKAISYTSSGGNDTIADIITDINTDLGASAVASINARGDLQVISATSGTNSSIVITDVDLFSSIKAANYQGLNSPLDGVDQGKQYFFGITGGSITLENNITSLVPEELGIVNEPLAAFSGSRSFTGTLNAYLNTGSNKTSGLLVDLLADTDATTNRFYMNIKIGGCATYPRVELIMPYAQVSVPAISVEDVISTEISFSAAGSEITQSDELEIHYYADTA